ncbi:MAG: glycosyltransferase family 1 protein [Pseudomonadota bacterium]
MNIAEPATSARLKPARHHRILIEGHNVALASGTGIATYARQLGRALVKLGYDPHLLVSSRAGVNPKDGAMSEIHFFDAEVDPTLGRRIADEARKLTVLPLPRKATYLPPFETVVSSASDRFAGFSKVAVVPHLSTCEISHFQRYGLPITVTPPASTDLFHATRPAPVRVKGAANIYTLHDIVPLRLPFTTQDNKKVYLSLIRDLCRKADHIVTVSEFSRRDIIKLTGISEHRITNTYQAVQLPERLANRDMDKVTAELQALFGLEPDGYFLFVGALEPKKNVSRLVDAYAAAGVDRPLVIVGGSGWMNEQDKKKLADERFFSYEIDGRRLKPKRSVRRLRYLPLDHLVSLIRGARSVLFPSLYEGFGLPVLEAMSLGTPVMTSTASCLPEIAGDAALLVDPYDIESISKAIRTLDEDDDVCEDLKVRGRVRAKEFSPERYEQRLDGLYTSILK